MNSKKLSYKYIYSVNFQRFLLENLVNLIIPFSDEQPKKCDIFSRFHEILM